MQWRTPNQTHNRISEMKLHVVHDAEAKILAASIASDDPKKDLIPRASSGQTYAYLDLPSEVTHLDLRGILSQVVLDTRSNKLKVKE
jgi:hypothetical protein